MTDFAIDIVTSGRSTRAADVADGRADANNGSFRSTTTSDANQEGNT